MHGGKITKRLSKNDVFGDKSSEIGITNTALAARGAKFILLRKKI
jgi:hypothetical protein